MSRFLAGVVATVAAAWLLHLSFSPATADPGMKPREITAERFTLDDGRGNKPASLRMTEAGAELVFADSNKRIRLVAGLQNDTSFIVLLDSKGGERLKLRVVDDTPLITVCNPDGSSAVMLATTKQGPTLEVGSDKTPALAISSLPRLGSLSMTLKDAAGNDRVGFVVSKDDAGVLIKDKTGRTLFGAPR